MGCRESGCYFTETLHLWLRNKLRNHVVRDRWPVPSNRLKALFFIAIVCMSAVCFSAASVQLIHTEECECAAIILVPDPVTLRWDLFSLEKALGNQLILYITVSQPVRRKSSSSRKKDSDRNREKDTDEITTVWRKDLRAEQKVNLWTKHSVSVVQSDTRVSPSSLYYYYYYC